MFQGCLYQSRDGPRWIRSRAVADRLHLGAGRPCRKRHQRPTPTSTTAMVNVSGSGIGSGDGVGSGGGVTTCGGVKGGSGDAGELGVVGDVVGDEGPVGVEGVDVCVSDAGAGLVPGLITGLVAEVTGGI